MQTQAEGIIYATVCLSTGKVYVGIDTKDRPSYLGSGKLLRLARKKYGDENFAKMTITHFATIEEGRALGRFWIKGLDAKVPNGYNLNDGGEGQFNPCEEVRKKLSDHNAMKRPEVRVKNSMAKMGSLPWNKDLTKETDERVKQNGANVSIAMIGNTNAKGKNLGNTYAKGHVGWNKDLTKETDERVKRYAGRMLGNTNGKANKGKKYMTKARRLAEIK